nr:ATP synthase F0 subunit 8 [Aepyornis maximus]
MPQLNPGPWLLIMTMSWMTLLLIMQPKLLHFTPTNPMSNKTKTSPSPTPWTWPWT